MSTIAEHKPQTTAYGFFLDGKWFTEGDVKEVHAPYDQSPVGRLVYATRAHAERAVQAATRAFETTRKLPAFERQRVLHHVAEGLSKRREEFARVLAQEAGKPLKAARAEVGRCIFTFNVAAEETTRIYGEVLPLDLQEIGAGRWGIVRHFPIGPVTAITPFNFPINLAAHKIGPAIAAGCTMILKPPPQDPLTTMMLAELVQEAGWPDGALNVLPLSNDDASVLVEDERIKMLSFTGSAAVGWHLKQKAGHKRVVLELGGNAGVIVHKDADVAYAAERCVSGGFSYAGQSCISVQRIFVEGSVAEKFTNALVRAVGKLKTGDPLDEKTDVGPLITERDAKRAEAWIEEAVAGGAKLLCGGKRHKSTVEPTVLTQTKPQMRVNCEEVFAPVVTVEVYDEFKDAVQRVNDSPFGLQAGVFTRDMSLAMYAYEELDVGGVIIGDIPSWRIDSMPYGGVKQSGLGREGLRYTIREMTEPKLMVMNIR